MIRMRKLAIMIVMSLTVIGITACNGGKGDSDDSVKNIIDNAFEIESISNDATTTQNNSEFTAEKSTEVQTEAPTDEPTTETITQPITDAPTQAPTVKPTNPPTEAPTPETITKEQYWNPYLGVWQDTPVETQNKVEEFSGESTTDKYVYAYKNNDTSKLNSDELAVYNVLVKVVNEAKKQGDVYNQEKYVHDWIICNCEYDYDAYNAYNNNTISSFKPFSEYGVFVNKRAVCDGYAKAFELCMKLLEIPCIRVAGTANGGPHGWNAVCLDGEWYQVDVTWDDVDDMEIEINYAYFNVTDEIMKKNHTYSCSVSCTATKYWYVRRLLESSDELVFTTSDEANAYIRSMIEQERSMIEQEKYEFPFTTVSLDGDIQSIWRSIDMIVQMDSSFYYITFTGRFIDSDYVRKLICVITVIE